MSTTVSHGPEDLARSRRRGTVVLALVVVLLGLAGLFTATGQSADPPTVTFVTPDGVPHVLPLSDVAPDITDKTYTVRNPDGSKKTQTIAAGYSIAALSVALSNLPGTVSIDPYPYLQVDKANGERVLLRRGQVTSETAFPDGPPVVWADDAGVHFLRPQADDDDGNSIDETVDPANLTIRLLEKVPFKISVKVTPENPKVGQTVRFSGSVSAGKAAGETLIFNWSSGTEFNDVGEKISHTFTKSGTKTVALRVSSDFDTNGNTKVIHVQVGKKKKAKAEKKDDGASDSGTSSGTSDGTSGTGGSSYTAPDLGTYDGYDSGTSAVTPAPVTPAPTPTPAPKPEPPKTTPKPPPTPTTPTTTVPTAPGEQTVQGTVLSGLSLAAASVPPAAASSKDPDPASGKTAAARTGTPQEPDDPNGGLHIPAGVWILLLLVLLLIGGFWQDAYRAVAPRSVPRIP